MTKRAPPVAGNPSDPPGTFRVPGNHRGGHARFRCLIPLRGDRVNAEEHLMGFEFKYVVESIPSLLQGAKLTWYITVIGIMGGLFLGTVAGLLRLAGSRAIGGESYGFPRVLGRIGQKLAIGYIELIRGTPIIVQAMFIYFALPMLIEVSTGIKGIRFNALTAAIITIIINAGAYMAEIVRGAVQSVNKGAGRSRYSHGNQPSAVDCAHYRPHRLQTRHPSPGKPVYHQPEGHVAFYCHRCRRADPVRDRKSWPSNFRALEIWSAVAVCYLIMTSRPGLLLKFIEKRMKIA